MNMTQENTTPQDGDAASSLSSSDLLDVLEAILAGAEFTWNTEDPHADNSETMNEFLECYLPEDYEIKLNHGTYAEIENDGVRYGVHASGRGDPWSHRVEFIYI